MTSELEQDLATNREALASARAELIDALSALTDTDLQRARRGGWTVARVLEHVIESEWLYARLISHLRDAPVQGDVVSGALSSTGDARARLDASREALLQALDGVDEEAFYRLRDVAHEEYSVLSVLENTAMHDHEHADQVRAIVA